MTKADQENKLAQTPKKNEKNPVACTGWNEMLRR
jgi:hypothetical protein